MNMFESTSYSEIGHSGITEFVKVSAIRNQSGQPKQINLMNRLGRRTEDRYHLNLPYSSQTKDDRSLNEEVLMTKLWVSAALRDNLVTVFGYLNNKLTTDFTEDLYISLQLIYSAAKRRRLDMMELLPVLKPISFEIPQNQYILLFREMENIAPLYLKSSVTTWIDALQNRKFDMNSAVRPGNGSLVVDILADIDVEILDVIRKPINFDQSTHLRVVSTNMAMIGRTLATTVSAISDGSLRLTQPLLAAILLHLPVSNFRPEVEEALRYLVDVMKEGYVKPWNIISMVKKRDMREPYTLVRAIVSRITEHKDVIGVTVKESAAYILPYIQMPNIWAIYSHRVVMNPIVGQPKMNVILLLSYVVFPQYPKDIINCRDIIISAIRNKTLDIYLVLKGFIRFDYSVPVELLIAITNRIRRRIVDLDPDVMSAVKALNAFLIFMKASYSWSPYVPKGIYDIITMLDAFGSPNLPQKLLKVQKILLIQLPEEKIDWMSVLPYLEIRGCSNPRQCLVQLFKLLKKKKLLVGTQSQALVSKLLSLLTANGEPKNFTPIVATSTKRKPVKHASDLHESSEHPALLEPPYMDHRSVPANLSYLFSDKTSKIHSFLSRGDLMRILGSSFQKSNYGTRGDLLVAILRRALVIKEVQQDSLLFEDIRTYLDQIDSSKNYIERCHKATGIPDYRSLAAIIPTSQGDIKDVKRNRVEEFLKRNNLSAILGPTFNAEGYKTKGLLLQAVLKFSLTLKEVNGNKDLKEAIEYYKDKIINMDGIASQTVTWLIGRTRSVDVDKLFKTIDEDHMTKSDIESLDRIFDFMIEKFNMSVHLAGFNFFVYNTQGQFMESMLKHLKSQVSEQLKRDIDKVIPYVQQTGPGEIPLEPIETTT